MKDVLGVVRSASLSAFGMGKAGTRILRRNVGDLIQQINRLKVDKVTKEALLSQARAGTYEVRLFGNTVKNTAFILGSRARIRALTGSRTTTVDLLSLK